MCATTRVTNKELSFPDKQLPKLQWLTQHDEGLSRAAVLSGPPCSAISQDLLLPLLNPFFKVQTELQGIFDISLLLTSNWPRPLRVASFYLQRKLGKVDFLCVERGGK